MWKELMLRRAEGKAHTRRRRKRAWVECASWDWVSNSMDTVKSGTCPYGSIFTKVSICRTPSDILSPLIPNIHQPPVMQAGIIKPEARAFPKVTGWSTMKEGYKTRQLLVLAACVPATQHSAKAADPTSTWDHSASPPGLFSPRHSLPLMSYLCNFPLWTETGCYEFNVLK